MRREHGRVDTNTRAQVRLILDHESDLARNAFDNRLKAIYAEHAAKGLLKSGATIKVALRAMEEIASRLIADCIDKVASVSKESEAFAMIAEAVQTYLSFLYDKAEPIGEMVGGKRDSIGLRDSILKATDDRFREARSRLERQLEIHRFTFTQPGPIAKIQGDAEKPDIPLPRNNGGKPRGAHWDAMWADIAVKLWCGDLQPQSQADIKRAMFDWFNHKEIAVGDTAITDRARLLWQRIEASE